MILRISIGTVLFAAPSMAAAQSEAPSTQIKLVNDCAAAATPEEIVVCAEREPHSPYRLPPQPDRFDPNGPVDSVSRERNRLIDVGAEGIGSCSTVGPGGYTGCATIAFKHRIEQKADAPRQREPWRVSVRAGSPRASEPR